MPYHNKEDEARYNKEWKEKQKSTPAYRERCRRDCKKYSSTPEAKQKRKEHDARPEFIARRRELGRRYLRINGVRVRVNKRPRPTDMVCEICHRVSGKLDWHHWEDEHPERGLWLCSPCHRIAEGADMGLVETYREVKESINKLNFVNKPG